VTETSPDHVTGGVVDGQQLTRRQFSLLFQFQPSESLLLHDEQQLALTEDGFLLSLTLIPLILHFFLLLSSSPLLVLLLLLLRTTNTANFIPENIHDILCDFRSSFLGIFSCARETTSLFESINEGSAVPLAKGCRRLRADHGCVDVFSLFFCRGVMPRKEQRRMSQFWSFLNFH
jgi:hypothetical protein